MSQPSQPSTGSLRFVHRLCTQVFSCLFVAQFQPSGQTPAAQRATSDVLFESTQLARSALLSAKLLRCLTAAAFPGAGAGSGTSDPPSAVARSLGHAEFLLPRRAKEECHVCGQVVTHLLGCTVRRVMQPFPAAATLSSFLSEGAPHLLSDPFSPAAAAARLRWPQAASQFSALLDCVQWRGALLQAVEQVIVSWADAGMSMCPLALNEMQSQLCTLAEFVPVRLAQWVEAAAPSAPGTSRLSAWVLSDLQVALSDSGADVAAVVARVAAHQQPSSTPASDPVAKQGADQRDVKQGKTAVQVSVEASGCISNISGAPFHALWGWSSATCARLMGELRTACGVGGLGVGPGQVGAVDAGAAVVVMQAAVDAAAAASGPAGEAAGPAEGASSSVAVTGLTSATAATAAAAPQLGEAQELPHMSMAASTPVPNASEGGGSTKRKVKGSKNVF